jgi:S1-C subfamily serine protease
LTIAGYGSGDYRAAAGRCTQYVAPDSNQPFEMVELDTAARQGDSGGPIFNSRGELAGVLFGTGHGTTSGSYCGRVRGFLESVLPSGDTAADNTSIAERDNQRPTQLNAMLPPDETTLDGPRTSRPRASLDNSYQSEPNTNRNWIAGTAPSPNDSRPNQGAARESAAANSSAGTSRLGQIKTFLAVVCGAAFVLHVLKLLSPKAKSDAEATDDTGEKTESTKTARGKNK